MSTQTQSESGLSWKDVCEDPNLHDLPYKIETNDRGQIVMSPTYAWHGRFAYKIAQTLEERRSDGVASVETAIRTTKGTKVADAVWCTADRWAQIKEADDAPVAPEICVEVRSPTNTDAEMAEKRSLYLEAGAEEVWICDSEGRLTFFDAEGERSASARVPDVPDPVDV